VTVTTSLTLQNVEVETTEIVALKKYTK